MKGRSLWSKALSVLCVIAICGILGSDVNIAAAQSTTWVTQSVFPANNPITKYGLQLWAQKVEEMSGGRLKIEVHGEGEIVPAASVLEAVRDGVLDAGQNTPAFNKGQYPAGDLYYTLPGGVTEFHDLLIWLYGGGGKELEQEMYGDAIRVFPLLLSPPEQIWTNKPINSIEDFKGLRIRSAGLAMELFQRLGASVVLLPGGEVVPSLQRGVIDAAEFLGPSVDLALGLADVAKYRCGPPIHMSSNIFQLLINPKKFSQLPQDLQVIVEEAAKAATLEGFALMWAEDMEADQKIRSMGIVTTKLPPEDQVKVREIAFQILEEKSASDPFFKKVWESQKSFLEKYRPFYNLSVFDISRQ